MIFPVKRGLIEEVEPEIRAMDTDPEVSEAYAEWAESRRNFNEGLKVPGSEEQAAKWQKDYFRGKARFGATPLDHRTKLRPREFALKR
jgi:anti-sigma factor RsiW